MRPAISCRQLRKVYKSGFFRIPFVAVEGLDLEVLPGEIFGFIGPNGAGKTSTIKMLMGLQSATSGEAEILGKDFRDPESKRAVGFLPERPYFYQHLTAREFLHFYGQLFEIPKPERSRRVESLLERVHLQRFGDVPLRNFSKGMLQRAGLAQALINDPDLVVMDEPMSGLDPMGRALVRDVIFEEKEKGKTVFFSSHILADVEFICDRVGIIVRGKLRGCGTVDELVGSRIRYVDCTFRLDGAVELPGSAVRQEGDVVQQRVAPDEVDGAIDAVRAAGGSVIEIHRHRETLENILIDEVERANPVDQKRMGVLA